ncbi:hypothetical protein JCM8547_009404 [Rhodosporidiobolus lusitaniae]
MASDPLADPPQSSQAEPEESAATPTAPAWNREDLFAAPFSTSSWAGRNEHDEASAAWGDAAAERTEVEAGTLKRTTEASGARDEDDDEAFSCPQASTTDEPPSTSSEGVQGGKENKTKPRLSGLRADVPAFVPSFVPPAPSAAIPVERPSSLHRTRSSSTSGLLPSSSVTPRGVESPLLRKATLDSSPVDPSSASPSSSGPPDLPPSPIEYSSTPQTSSPLPALPPPDRTPSRASSSKGYDPTVLRNLISTAASNGDLERLKSLIAGNKGGDEAGPSAFTLANKTSPHTGLAPLHYAAQAGHVDVVQWLVEEAGAMPELEDAEGETPLHRAAHRGHLDVCRFLISRDVEVGAQDADGWTALHNASSRGWLDIARLLVSAGASVDQPNKHNYTPLMNAASKGQLPLVHYLLKQGATPLRRNAFGETAYDLAASVFEVQICSVLAAAEAAAYTGADSTRDPYNPLDLHSTVPVLLHENQRLQLPTLKKLSSISQIANRPTWSAKALSRNDARAAFSLLSLPGVEGNGEAELPCFRSEVGLPFVGEEGMLVLPERREIRSGGRVRVAEEAPPSSPSSSSKKARPATLRKSSAASASLSAALASSSSSPRAPSNSTSSHSSAGEPAWIWLSDWVVGTTAPTSSPVDGWSYASSFDTPADKWTAEPPVEVQRAFEGGPGLALSGKKWVRRRNWVRVMRRRVDLPDWGYADLPPFPRRPSSDTTAVAAAYSPPSSLPAVETVPPSSLDYRARAQFLAGVSHTLSTAGNASDRASVRSGKTAVADEEAAPTDRAELKKLAARLERAADELRKGMVTDEDADRRRKAEEELEAFLHQLALVRVEIGSDGLDDDEDEDDDEFVYYGKDAGDDDDARSIWTSARPASVRSDEDEQPIASSSNDYFSQPLLPPSSSSSPPASVTSPYSAPYSADLTPQLARAPDFRVPTHEQAPSIRTGFSSSFVSTSVRPRWQRDDETNECKICSTRFTLFKRKHHCRRCGFVVCAACSPHNDPLDPYTVALEPGAFGEDTLWLSPGLLPQYRTCQDCHAALTLPFGLASASSLLSPQAFFPASPSLGTATPSEAAASDASELVECPVCGTTLASLGGKSQAEAHIRDCLETGSGSIASGRYLVFTLPPGPLAGEECRICFEDFEVGDQLARMSCLCCFHKTCISAWLNRGNSCPVHASREN